MINYVLNLGLVIFVFLIILIFGLLVGMKFKKVFMFVLILGIVFSGMFMVIGYMFNVVSLVLEVLVKNMGISLLVFDLGWMGVVSIIWLWSYVFIFFVVMIGVNFVFLFFNWMKMLNVDMWNVWGKVLIVYLVYYVFGSLVVGFFIVMV